MHMGGALEALLSVDAQDDFGPDETGSQSMASEHYPCGQANVPRLICFRSITSQWGLSEI